MSITPYITDLQPIQHATAESSAKNILDIALKQVGFIPNMYANMANAPAVLSTYLHGYGLFRNESGLTAAEQEVVFLAISQANGCNYCTAAHSMLADKMSGVPKDVLNAIRSHEPIPNPKLAALYTTAKEMVRTHGQPDHNTVKTFIDMGFQERDLLYIILAISVKTLSNFTNHAFNTEIDAAFADYQVSCKS